MKFKFNGEEWYINEFLSIQLDSLVYNVRHDWDFVVLITGDRTVRTGKSVLGMTVCAYLASRMAQLKLKTTYTLDNLFFESKKMISQALVMPQYSIVHYDEGREGLASSKFLNPFQMDLLDYFAECGQLNHIFVIVLPDFFGLNEEIAIARSECLINVYRKDEKIETDLYGEGKIPIVRFKRGEFEFFNRYKKQELYDKAKLWRKKNYNLVKPNFYGSFTNQYTLDEKEYRKKKKEFLSRFRERKDIEGKTAKTDIFRDKELISLFNEGKKASEIQIILKREYDYDITTRHIHRLLAKLIRKRVEGGEPVDFETD